MSQITLYLDPETHALVERAARASGLSKSRWLLPAELGVPAIVEYELRFGLMRLPQDARQPRMTALEQQLHPVRRLPFDEQRAEHAARIARWPRYV